ncbi:hypothetical protein CFC21_093981 [Triticum aestivum]|uniref:Wax synthase domain-containing protein n=4 Tax=Triticinae TaxID=1648030 RepID=A0A453PRS2_AEGTS|nr:probable long-chain-alcohol O-fatty-acyltransferase 1 [Aegilops tauschii subsp. strangulata]XP_044416905.1 probable long-chain-alcohol O-fatty-acyltransferase 1 [Triticum aestivum]KAF7091389.1 hypothetical protein CFC21_093981 [Triticum aestivum]
MGFPRDSITAMVPLAAALYVRLASSVLGPGLVRLVALLPVLTFLAAVPLAFSSTILRGTAALFLAWLCLFKVALLAVGSRPLDPALPVIPFVFTASLPVMPRRSRPGAKANPGSGHVVSCAAKVAALAAILQLFRNRLHLHARLALYGIVLYCFFYLLLACLAAIGGALGMDMERPFDRPLLASSLSDFWGRRWNLVMSGILRAAVYDPMQARVGKPAGIMATFLVSGLMHEAMMCYITLRRPTGAMLAFFMLQGAARVAEDWCSARGLRPRPRAVRTLLVLVSIASTAFWLILPLVSMSGAEEKLLEEWAAVTAFFQDGGRYLLPYR